VNNGFIFSVEGAMSLLFLGLILLTLTPPENEGPRILPIVQKQHDLIVVWDATNTQDTESLQKDFETVFPDHSGTITFGKTEIIIGIPKQNAIVSDGWITTPKRIFITLVVYDD
jgi:hypothetical protein